LLDEGAEELHFVLELCGVGGGEVKSRIGDDVGHGDHWWGHVHGVAVWTMDHDAGGAGLGSCVEDVGAIRERGVGGAASIVRVGGHVARVVQVEVCELILEAGLVETAVRVAAGDGGLAWDD
jgi:hypothetical protein